MTVVAALSFSDARACVVEKVTDWRGTANPEIQWIPLLESHERVLALDITADRDYPPLNRSIRDGFAVRSQDLPGRLRVVGETRAGQPAAAVLKPGETVEIMTGAPVPPGADAVLMVEHVVREDGFVVYDQPAPSGQFINPCGAEVRAGEIVVNRGSRAGFAAIAMMASVGMDMAPVYRRPLVSIISTGDEIVELGRSPLPHQIRNSNSFSLAAQVERGGGVARILPIAPDNVEGTRTLVEEGLAADLLLLSGGVSAGRYDVVEEALSELGAEFYFDRVLIQPGQPLVFGKVRDRFFFGLPGNPASTMVTFEVFAKAALQLLAGETEARLPMLSTRISHPLRHKPGLTRFLPAALSADGSAVTLISGQGSGDIRAVAQANAFLVVDPDIEAYAPGDWIRVILK